MFTLAMLPLIFLFILPMSPLTMSLGLVFFSLVSIFTLILQSTIPTLTALTFILVYLGSMMIMSSYVCAVVPNIMYPSTTSYIFHTLMIFTFLLLNIASTMLLQPQPPLPLPTISSAGLFFFSLSGLVLFASVITLMLVVLNASTSMSLPQSPMRVISSLGFS